MSMTPIRTAIRNTMLTVADIGVVHVRERYATALADLKNLYYSAPHAQIRGWYISRSKVAETGRIQNTSFEVTTWRINGFMSFKDDEVTELTLDDLVEEMRAAFRANDSLDGTVAQCSIPSPGGGSREANLQLVDAGPVMFAGVLCHGVKLQLPTIRYLTRTV
ncbi:MAG: hypothetical protein HYV17_08045 [Xanthomonadales bacterium]|nr:hypothetical protein [Xanthomonadales bacterium]